MGGAAFILVINLSVAGLFAAAFFLISLFKPNCNPARWFALAYAAGMVNILLEGVIPLTGDYRPYLTGAYAAFLAAIAIMNIGLARMYSAGIAQASYDVPEAAGTFVGNHDPQASIVPGLRKRDELGAIARDGQVGDGSIDITGTGCLDELPESGVRNIMRRQIQLTRYDLPEVDRHTAKGVVLCNDERRTYVNAHIDAAGRCFTLALRESGSGQKDADEEAYR